ncbi:GNAT family N-acetyltransferase [Pacificimonas sp. WHA3]|uniref:GNAT family N-acetyltransferase n=2 Tax=Pacificimonas pallii TaxID=2827236 RepID=A0ABS6SDV7_9SPHN|nr:GNAT family N-acetyltransferase [Pacificimonas pallii]
MLEIEDGLPDAHNGWRGRLETRSGRDIRVRPAHEDDEARLDAFFRHVTPEDLRFRFLSPMRQVSEDQIHALSHVDHRRTENFLAFDAETHDLVATAMLAGDDRMETAEVAMVMHEDYKGRGIGWALLSHVARFAEARGFQTLKSIESREHRAAIQMEREMGFTAASDPDDGSIVVLTKTLG